MGEYGYDDKPPAASGSKSDHERVVTSGAWLGAMAVAVFLCWAGAQVPYVCAWLINTAVILPATYAVARHKSLVRLAALLGPRCGLRGRGHHEGGDVMA
jgi:apolipoprotein N-acyltransferase